MTWEFFKRQCDVRFGPPLRDQQLEELTKLKQTGTMADYQDQFEELLSLVGTLTQSQKVQLYISGLNDAIAVWVQVNHPLTLTATMSMSRLFEQQHPGRPPPTLDDFYRPLPETAIRNRIIKRLSQAEWKRGGSRASISIVMNLLFVVIRAKSSSSWKPLSRKTHQSLNPILRSNHQKFPYMQL